jgi:hypothetical protein
MAIEAGPSGIVGMVKQGTAQTCSLWVSLSVSQLQRLYCDFRIPICTLGSVLHATLFPGRELPLHHVTMCLLL